MTDQLFTIHMPTGADWPVGLGDLLLAASLVVLFVELLKSTTSRRIAIINHSLSMILFIVCLIEFLLAPAFATSTFFLITVMVLLDVLAGFIVTIVSARRDIDFAGVDSHEPHPYRTLSIPSLRLAPQVPAGAQFWADRFRRSTSCTRLKLSATCKLFIPRDQPTAPLGMSMGEHTEITAKDWAD
jgi:hypothetical protein